METILLIDDDVAPMKYYVKRLKTKYNVVQKIIPDDAYDFLNEKKGEICCIILDIMLPPSKKYKDHETSEGLKTGVLLYKDILNDFPKIPIIVFTNVRNPKTLTQFKENDHLRVLRKNECSAKELLMHVNEMSLRKNEAKNEDD